MTKSPLLQALTRAVSPITELAEAARPASFADRLADERRRHASTPPSFTRRLGDRAGLALTR